MWAITIPGELGDFGAVFCVVRTPNILVLGRLFLPFAELDIFFPDMVAVELNAIFLNIFSNRKRTKHTNLKTKFS